MIDTATAYGAAEVRLAQALTRLHVDDRSRCVVASKWCGSFERELAGGESFRPTIAQLRTDSAASLALFGSLEVLYTHLPSSVPVETAIAALADPDILAELEQLKVQRRIRHIGASISHADVLQRALDNQLLDAYTYLQLPVRLCASHPALCKTLQQLPLHIVFNSPVRGFQQLAPEQALSQAVSLCQRLDATLLTGTRTHLKHTLATCSALLV
jgi:aryl-alcohol dehydrogenase-like predicted oxidoreductase